MKNRFLPALIALQLASGLMLSHGCVSWRGITRQGAIDIAKQEWLRRSDTEKDFEIDFADFREGNWEITISRLPGTVGGHATFVISPRGKLVRIWPGA